MLSFITCVFDFVINLFYEVSLYIIVDAFVKIFLKEARDDDEKRTIWAYEGAVLLGVCGIMYFHHVPYMLLVSALATLIYTQLVGRVNFRYWWYQLITRWDEFEQHEESMEQYNEMQSRQLNNPNHPPPNVQVTMAPTHTQHWMPQQIPVQMPTYPVPPEGAPQQIDAFPQFEPWYPACPEKVSSAASVVVPSSVILTHSGPISSTPVSAHSVLTSLHHQRPLVSNHPQMLSPIYSSPPFMTRFPPPVLPRPDLARRPIHPLPATFDTKNHGLASRVKNKVMSALGLPEPLSMPPGLYNNGSNLCFLNSIIQCVANSPGLVDALSNEVKSITTSPVDASFAQTAEKLFNLLRTHPSHVDKQMLSHTALREAACQLRGSMIVSPSRPSVRQEQQDAAECLMWMLQALHAALNSNAAISTDGRPLNHVPDQHSVPHRYSNVALNMLKFIYGDLTPARIRELKLACQKEISQANGVDNDTYAEPIQRLSDLEWLSYKDKNLSVIDDLFTGQLVEAQHCLACNRVSVSIQTFNILPVPIVEARQINGLVYLEDCFTKFGNIEDFYGTNGLRCDNCNDNADSRNNMAAKASPGLAASPIAPNVAANQVRQRHKQTADSDAAGFSPSVPMSPIPATGDVFMDSGFHDNHIRTSTPIRSTTATTTGRLTNGQRRSLLRQLPDCLVVQLMRFTVSQGVAKKIQKPVSIPLVNLDLTHLIIDNVMKREDLTALHASFKYSLYAVCLHLGADSTTFGHYVAYVKASDNAWYRCDDEKVQPVNMEYELYTRQVRENAYLLFYKKVM